MEPKDYIAVVAAFIALGSVAASVYITLRGQRRQYFADMRKWADEASDTLSGAVHLCDLNPSHKDGGGFFAKRHDLRVKLSSLVDRGRWFFPNLYHAEVGHGKDDAFRGLRQPALDLLVHAYRFVGSMSYTDQKPNVALRDTLVDVKRKFVSEVQNYLDPRNRRTTFARLTEFTGRQVDGSQDA